MDILLSHRSFFLFRNLLAILIIIAGMPISQSFAASCVERPFQELFDEADAVFLSHVVSVGSPQAGDGDQAAFQTVLIKAKLIRLWKGKVAKEPIISVTYLPGYTGQPFKRNGLYVIFAKHHRNTLTTSHCTVVGPIPQNYYYVFKLLAEVGEGERIGNNRLDRERENDNKQQQPAGAHSGSNYLE